MTTSDGNENPAPGAGPCAAEPRARASRVLTQESRTAASNLHWGWEGKLGRVELLKVSSKSNPHAVAGAIAGIVRQGGDAEIQVVGAGALNQAIKGVAIARGFVADAGMDLVCAPSFAEVAIDGQARTALRLVVEDRAHLRSAATPTT